MHVPDRVKLDEMAVEAEGLVLRRNGDPALAASTFSLPRGAVTAVVGPNGSGKTTVLHAIAGLLAPSAGRIAVLGSSPDTASERVAYVLQAPQVEAGVPVSAREVVTLGRFATRGLFGRLTAEDHQTVRACLERLEVGALADRHLRELSAGQRQRVLVAQALAQGGDLLLMDEPGTSLDGPGRQLIADVIAAEREADRTVVVTTHGLGEALRADHVLLLAGRVVASGRPDQVLTRSNLTEAYGGQVVDLASGPTLLDDAVHGHSH